MGEEDIRARQDSIDAHILAIESKLDVLRKELQESIMNFYNNTRDTHQRLYDRVDAVEEDVRGLKVELARFTPIIDAMQKHMDNDVPVDVARNRDIVKIVAYVAGLCASGFIGWLFSHLGSRQ